MLDKLTKDFKEIYGAGKVARFFSPGRVNLIGEHTDYNGGFVFPCALDFGTYGIARKREDKICKVYSLNFENMGVIEFNIDDLKNDKKDGWSNYVKAVIDAFIKGGYDIKSGFDLLVYGNIPNGAGLSSSASLELLISVILKDFNNLDVSMIDMVKLSQKAENNFIGVSCGIMDQFAIGMGKKNHAILLDCNTLNYKYAPIDLGDVSIVIANTNKKRGLADSKYNERRATCEECVEILNKNGVDIKYLGELTPAKYEEVKKFIDSEEGLKRSCHAVYENARTTEAFSELEKNNIKRFGELMNDSHKSLCYDYEVTGKELDSLVEAAWEENAIGARMTGAGFGGCTVSLVSNDKIDDFIKNVGKKYFDKTGLKAEFYVANIGDGTHKIDEVTIVE